MVDELNLLIHAIYEAGANPAQWHVVLSLLASSLHGTSATVHMGDTDGSGFSFGSNHNYDPESLATYADHYYKINPLNPPLLKVQAGTAIGHHQLCSHEDYIRSPFRQEYGRRYNMEGSITAVLANDAGTLTCVGVTSQFGEEPFADVDIAKMQCLVPHLQRALDINRKIANLEAANRRGRAAVADLQLGVVFLGREARIIDMNDFAGDVLRLGFGLAARGNKLVCTSSSQPAFAALVTEASCAAGVFGGTLAVERGHGRRPLMVRVVPYAKITSGSCETVAAVFIRDPELSSGPQIEDVAHLYGLTPSECRVVVALVEKLDVKEVADQLGIAEVTVRNHLARAMSKTQTTKIADLVKLVLNSMIPLKK